MALSKGLETFLIIVFCLAAVSFVAYYVVTRYEDPPLWWPNWMRPGWAKVR